MAYRQRDPLGGDRLWWERLCDFWMLGWRYHRGDRSCEHLFPGAAALVEWWTGRRERVLDAFATV